MGMPKTLVVDDEEIICEMLREILSEEGYETVTVSDPRQVMDTLRADAFDVVLLDLKMPEISGMELLKLIKEQYIDLPVLIVTGNADIGTAVEAIKAGASDFITKPFDNNLLNLRIRKTLAEKELKRLAITDGLTGLYNKRYFSARLQEETERAVRYLHPLSLMMIDIDFFKQYNDTHGHPKGDEVLKQVAHILKENSRESDIVARYGGEEFAMVLPETDKDSAERLARRIRERIELFDFWGQEVLPNRKLTVSIGVTSYLISEQHTVTLERADQALYQAKRKGRNQVCTA